MLTPNTPSESPRRVAIYIRVSTAEQKVEGYSLEAQEKRLVGYVENNKALNLTTKKEWIYSDVHTGSDLNRPRLQELLQDVRAKKFDAVLVWKIDRLSRTLKHLLIVFEEFEKHEVSFISVQENIDFKGPIGKLIFQIFGAIAQFERELIKGRTMMGKITSAELGNYTGTAIPYGYKPVMNKSGKGKRLQTIPTEKKWVEQMFAWYIYDGLGFGQIAKKLNTLKVPRGEHAKVKDKHMPWTTRIVENIITDQIYRGIFVANRKDENGAMLPETEWTIVPIPACVSNFTYDQAQTVRKERVGGRKGMIYLLSGKMQDVSLEKPRAFSGAKRHKGGFSYRRRQFVKKDGTREPVFEMPGNQIEEWVWSKIMEAMKNPEGFIKHYFSREFIAPGRIEKLDTQLAQLREKQINIEALEIPRIQNAYENGTYSEEALAERLSRKNAELAEIEGTIQKLEDELRFASSQAVEIDSLKEAAEHVKYQFSDLTREKKKVLCNMFIDHIDVTRTEISPKDSRSKRQKKQWKVNAEIYFRFNPQKLAEDAEKVRTHKGQQENKKRSHEADFDNHGGSGGI